MATVKLPRLPVNWKEQPQLFERYWDDAMKQIETTLNAILDIPAIEAALIALDAATEAAQDAADNANAAADATTSESSIVNSGVLDGSYAGASPLEADAAGNVTVKIHTRRYGNVTLNPDVVITPGDTLATGAAATDIVRVFYDDPTRADATPTFQFSIDPAAQPIQGGDRHVVGAVEIPGAGTSDGGFVRPPGYTTPTP